MVAYMADSGKGRNPFRTQVDLPGKPTPRAPGGEPPPRRQEDRPAGSAQARSPARSTRGTLDILGFNYRARRPAPAGARPGCRRCHAGAIAHLREQGDDRGRRSSTRSPRARRPATGSPASRIRSPTARSRSSRARWATSSRPPRVRLTLKTPDGAARPAPTRTSAGSIPSCAAPSASRSSRARRLRSAPEWSRDASRSSAVTSRG